MGQLVAKEASKRLDVPFGIVDLSLVSTPAVGNSVAHILEEMGLEVVGTHGTTAVRVIPAPGCKVGDMVEFVGLLGRALVMPVNKYSSSLFIKRGGRIPAPIHSFKN